MVPFAIIVALAIQFFGVESAFVAWVGHLSSTRFLKGMAPAAVTAFTTQSSIGTLPVTIRSLTQNLSVDEDVASFTAGLGANLGMPGCAGMRRRGADEGCGLHALAPTTSRACAAQGASGVLAGCRRPA